MILRTVTDEKPHYLQESVDSAHSSVFFHIFSLLIQETCWTWAIRFFSDLPRQKTDQAVANALTLNVKKAEATALGLPYTVRLFKDLDIYESINNSEDTTRFFDEILSLGQVLDSTLFWGTQISHITKKINKALFGLMFIRFCTIQALAGSTFDYCTFIYLDTYFDSTSRYI